MAGRTTFLEEYLSPELSIATAETIPLYQFISVDYLRKQG